MIDNIFSSKETFRDHFEQGLIKLLQYDELGVFILSLANASFDQHTHDNTEEALLSRYHYLKQLYTEALKNGQQLQVPDDDLMVF
ncbi:MAG: hypothetical protein HQL46_04095, partial [Gammaproteobacteria bacterium]|nr:hypothetical protein [Gammaproteobacteria bacterium]